MPEKIIFLDVDGVLNSTSFGNYMFNQMNVDIFYENLLDKHAIANLKQIVDETKAKIVLSSSWKEEEFLKNKIQTQLLESNLNFIDITPEGTNREEEIKLWLSNHPEITNFVILDDEKLDFKEQVKIKFYYGLTKDDAKKAIKILNGVSNA